MLSENNETSTLRKTAPAWVARVLRIEWLGQTAASLCWIASVFFYGLSSTGDYLQLCAASAWLVANIATVVTIAEMREALRIKRSRPAQDLDDTPSAPSPGWEPAEPASA